VQEESFAMRTELQHAIYDTVRQLASLDHELNKNPSGQRDTEAEKKDLAILGEELTRLVAKVNGRIHKQGGVKTS
jgi:hypothetical protein